MLRTVPVLPMLISFKRRLIIFSMPKCASTSIEKAVSPYCDIVMKRPAGLKHLSYRRFASQFLPMLQQCHKVEKLDDFKTFCVVREPLDWLHSWYRYRSRTELASPAHLRGFNSCQHLEFPGFLRCYLDKENRENTPARGIGTQHEFVADLEGRVAVKTLFAFENLALLEDALSAVFQKKITFDKLKQSRVAPLQLDAAMRRQVEQTMASDFALHASLQAASGQEIAHAAENLPH